MWHYKNMILDKTILTISLLLFSLLVQGQNIKISYNLTLGHVAGCETQRKDCYPLNINRKTVNDSIQIYFPIGSSMTDAYLYSDSVFHKNLEKPEFLRHDKKYATQGILKIDMTGLLDGKYRALMQPGPGGYIEINIKTINSNCIQAIDTIDGMTVYSSVEKMPYYYGGDQKLLEFIAKNAKYPVITNSEDFHSRIIATFIVDTAGMIRKPCILNPKRENSISPFESEFVRVLQSMPDWKPGISNGRNVPVRFTLPMNINWR